ncbi:DUF1120 domain-containing protein [Citrobacter arsenatis]|uniref:DUF1120 domain-containing protein n=1 Tax=Citrobacter arsenatis TaxID=2546350 RepID=UPI00300E1A89
MKKPLLKLCAVASVLVLSAYASAADTVDLAVTGTITMGSCTPTLSAASLDFGNISTAALANTHQTAAKQSTLTITCASAMAVGFKFADDRVDSVDANNDGTVDVNNTTYGIGFTDVNKTTPLGNAVIGVGKNVVSNVDLSPQIDGANATILKTTTINDASSWVTADTKADSTFTYSVAAQAGTQPQAFLNASIPLSVALNLNSADKLNLTADAPVDGQVTISVVYL